MIHVRRLMPVETILPLVIDSRPVTAYKLTLRVVSPSCPCLARSTAYRVAGEVIAFTFALMALAVPGKTQGPNHITTPTPPFPSWPGVPPSRHRLNSAQVQRRSRSRSTGPTCGG